MSSPTNRQDVNSLIDTFIGPNADYYRQQFAYITEAPGYRPTFNIMAAIFSPVWHGARGLWNWFLPLLLIETFGYIQMARGLFGDLGRDQKERAANIERTLKRLWTEEF